MTPKNDSNCPYEEFSIPLGAICGCPESAMCEHQVCVGEPCDDCGEEY